MHHRENEKLQKLLETSDQELKVALESLNQQKEGNTALKAELQTMEAQLSNKIEELQASSKQINALEERISSLEKAQAEYDVLSQEVEKQIAIKYQLTQSTLSYSHIDLQ